MAILVPSVSINVFKYYAATLKVPGPISQNGDFYSNDASLAKKSWFQNSASVKPFG